jgi:hypothetical protein
VYGTSLGEQDLQVLTRGYTVAKLKLDSLALLNDIADRNSAGLLICTNQVPNEKVSSLELIPMLVDDDTEMESQVCVSPVCVLERFEDILESLERRFPPKFVNQILLRLGHDESIADRTATLRDHRSNRNRPRQLYADESIVENVIVEQQPVGTSIMTSPGQTPYGLGPRIPLCHQRQHVLYRRSKGIGDQDKSGIRYGGLRPIGYLDLILHIGKRKSERSHVDLGQARDPEREGRGCFQFFGSADYALTGTTHANFCVQRLLEHGRDDRGLRGMVGREEHERKIHRMLADLLADGVRDVSSGRFRVGISRERRRKLERPFVCGMRRMCDHCTASPDSQTPGSRRSARSLASFL